ncbi:CorA metal ion transporter [Coemansia spiralis]|nr:CorA metal ion transporter [Coemansia spiralis]
MLGVGLAALGRRARRGGGRDGSSGGDGAPFWLDVGGSPAHELHELAELFGLHPLTVEDIEQGCSRDKIDVFGDYLFVVYHTVGSRQQRNKWQSYYRYCRADSSIRPTTTAGYRDRDSDSDIDGEGGSEGGPIFIVLTRNAVLTFHGHGREPERAVERVAARVAAIGAAAEADGNSSSSNEEADDVLGRLAEYPAYIAYAILDEVTDQLAPEIAAIEQQVDAIDELVLVLSHAEHESALRQMGEQRRRILQAWQLAQPKAAVVAGLAKALGGGGRQRSVASLLADRALADEVVQYLGDVHEHLAAAADACARAEAVLARSHSNYLAKISLELSRATYDANSTTERLTMLGAIVVPINIVTGFLGVNLKVPGQDRDDTLNFFVVLACMVIYAGVTLAFWRGRRAV